MLSIYRYSEPHLFLKDAWQAKKSKNPAFSMRSWAKRLGFESNAPLSLMLAGKRPIPKKYVARFSEDLGLSGEESLYLDAMIDFRNAKSRREREFHYEKLKRLAHGEPLGWLELEHFRFLGDPIHTTILEMIDLEGFLPEPQRIKEALAYPATMERIEAAIDRLAVLGLVEQGPDGGLVKKQKLITTKHDVADEGSQEYHRRVSALAAEALAQQPVLEREFDSYAMNIKAEDLPKAKQMIRDFAMRFIKEIEAAPGEANDTYQLNLQLFRVASTRARERN